MKYAASEERITCCTDRPMSDIDEDELVDAVDGRDEDDEPDLSNDQVSYVQSIVDSTLFFSSFWELKTSIKNLFSLSSPTLRAS